MIRLDFASGSRGHRLDLLAAVSCFQRREEAGEPAIAEFADAPQRARRAAAEPDVQRLGWQWSRASVRHGEELALEGNPFLADEHP